MRRTDLTSILWVLTSCHPAAPSDGMEQPGVTWCADVAPLIDAHCTACHTAGGVASFALADFASASAVADRIATYTTSGSMPPWLADPTCAEYTDELPLSAAEVGLLTDWAAAGAPRGDPTEAVELALLPPLDRVDRTFPLPEPYTPTQVPWERRCFMLPWEGTDAYVTGLWLAPGAADEVRSAVAWRAGTDASAAYLVREEAEIYPGWDCTGTESALDLQRVGAWTAGQVQGRFPAGTGVFMGASDSLVLQISYRSGSVPDGSKLQLQLEASVDAPAQWVVIADPAWAQGGFSVPAGSTGTSYAYDQLLPAGTVRAVSAELGYYGASARLTIDGACLLDVPKWDAVWRRTYPLASPTTGDTLRVECTFDNDSEDAIGWGDTDGEERCLGLVYLAGS